MQVLESQRIAQAGSRVVKGRDTSHRIPVIRIFGLFTNPVLVTEIKRNLTRVTNTTFNPAGPENFKTDSNEAGLLSKHFVSLKL